MLGRGRMGQGSGTRKQLSSCGFQPFTRVPVSPVCPTSWRQDWEEVLFYKLGEMSEPQCAEVQASSAPGGRLPRLRAGGKSGEGGTAGDPVAFITVRPGTTGRLDWSP